MPGSSLQEALRRGEFTTEGLLQLASQNALEQLSCPAPEPRTL
jgi:hypothetical protein